MRQPTVPFALDELGARECAAGYTGGNAASAAVSRKVGYRETEVVRSTQPSATGQVEADEHRVVVPPETFGRPTAPVRFEGTAELQRFLVVEA